MSVEIPNGAVAVYRAQFQTPWGSFTTDFMAVVSRHLADDGLTLINYQVNNSFAVMAGSPADVSLNILNGSGQELDDSDLDAQFSDAITQSNGTPIGGGLVSVTAPDSGINTGSGSKTTTTAVGQVLASQQAAAQNAPTVHQCGDPTWSFFQDPVQWIKCLTTGGLTTVGLLAIGLLVGVVLIVTAQKRGLQT